MADQHSLLQFLDSRTREIFKNIVETYLATGEPVGSRTVARTGIDLSAASIRNVMSDLTDLGLLDAPHISAGRMPTHAGLRLFVDGFLEIKEPSLEAREDIDQRLSDVSSGTSGILHEASALLSGLSGAAGLVSSPKNDTPIRHVEFVPLSPNEALCVLVTEQGDIENRILTVPTGLPQTVLIEAGNYLAAKMKGRTLPEAAGDIEREIADHRAQLDKAAADLVRRGLVQWSGSVPGQDRSLIIAGQANLLNDRQTIDDLERVRQLFEVLERQQGVLDVLDSTREADGVRLFIGSENSLFPLSGSSMIVAPYMNTSKQVIGALGVIGPTRLNYARIIPMVDYTARIVGQMLGRRGNK